MEEDEGATAGADAARYDQSEPTAAARERPSPDRQVVIVTFPICAICAVEHAERTEICAICADGRHWVPATGQAWTSLEEMRHARYGVQLEELEPGLHGVASTPAAGIGQQSKPLQMPAGNILWDPIGYLDDAAVGEIQALGGVAATPPATRTCPAPRASGAARSAASRSTSRQPTPVGSRGRAIRSPLSPGTEIRPLSKG